MRRLSMQWLNNHASTQCNIFTAAEETSNLLYCCPGRKGLGHPLSLTKLPVLQVSVPPQMLMTEIWIRSHMCHYESTEWEVGHTHKQLSWLGWQRRCAESGVCTGPACPSLWGVEPSGREGGRWAEGTAHTMAQRLAKPRLPSKLHRSVRVDGVGLIKGNGCDQEVAVAHPSFMGDALTGLHVGQLSQQDTV